MLAPLSGLTAAQLAGTSPVVNGSGCLTWHSTLEITGDAAASYTLNDGPLTSGQTLMEVSLSEGQSTRDYIGLHALSFVNGLYLHVTEGSIGGDLHAWVDHLCEQYLHTEHLAAKLLDEAMLAAFAQAAAQAQGG